jgi:inorganic pyrophosphatase
MMTDFSEVEVVIEIPKGSRNKYELDHQTGSVKLDRVLYSSVHYPTDYGYIPNTRAADGDELDVLVIIEEPTFPGCRMCVRPIGVLMMRDEEGIDEKILAVAVADARYEGISDISQIHHHRLIEIENFFNTYKTLEGKVTTVEGWRNSKVAQRVLAKYQLVKDE